MNDAMSNKQTSDIISVLSEKFFRLKEANRVLDNEKKDNNKIIGEVQKQLLDVMEEEGLEKFGTKYGSLTRKIDLYPTINDFIQFITWVFKTKAFEFVQKRVNAAPVREMLKETNTIPPGLDTYNKEVLLARINPSFRSEIEKQKGEQ